jgi:NodT family efflux transporter outer membrane factor (OMF) lipoprotein
LSLQAELASDYIAVRGLDAELDVLRQSIASYQAAVEIARLRMRGGIASGLDLARALSELDSARAQESETALQRDLMQHAVAVLVGAIPSSFSIGAVNEFRLIPPPLPPGFPSELLQRRPDIASAERQMAAANASIGVSRAAFYPHVTFSGTAGFEDNAFNLLSLPNSLWSVGAGAVLPLIDGGLRRAELRRSWSQYTQTRDLYRATVLAAFREVEDGLSLTQRLATEATQQREASEQAAQALSISTMLYEQRPGQLFERVGCPGAGPRSAHHGGPNRDPAGAGGGVADPRVGWRMDCASTARRKADPLSWGEPSVRTLKASPKHLDGFESGVAKPLDYAHPGPHSSRNTTMLFAGRH